MSFDVYLNLLLNIFGGIPFPPSLSVYPPSLAPCAAKKGGGKNKKETSPGRLELPTSRLTVGRANQLRHGDFIVAKVSGDGFISGSRNNGFVLATTETMNWTDQTQCCIYDS
ncbi:hypothetical protein N7527_008537 [Penicillium freii]|uniref:Uncharacterized protein n=1 Tax=Penicillium freii TaxID=48697 RepID=A0A101MBG7_PENFR|nr:hypothetical protein N7527_008537 [Penicillium freii]KUM57514.1 hypothetical protein ACN42_g9669 [Penicillium freii]